jgi:carboxylesterase
VLHGFTGSPFTMRAVAERLADEGLSVELPRLPGHGTAVEDLIPTRWDDWSAAAEQAYRDLAARCDRTIVVGISMGGTLTCWLAEHHPEIAGLALVNPLVEPPAEDFRAAIRGLVDSGTETAPGIGSDIAEPGVTELSYDATPLAAVLSLFDATDSVAAGLGAIHCPVLLLSSRVDHVVAPSSGDLLEKSVGGPCERVLLERSYHVATLDYDRDEIEARIAAFASSVLGGPDR